MEVPETISLPQLQAIIRERYRSVLPNDTYARYSNGKWPKVIRFLSLHLDLIEAYCADARAYAESVEPPAA